MAQRIYRTAQGKKVDMGALLLKNEDVRAVGNMGVNAKGDLINNSNTTTSSRTEQVNQQYRKQIRNQIIDVPTSKQPALVIKDEPEIIEGFDNEGIAQPVVEEKVVPEPAATKKTAGGLASAIAKAREVEQKKLQTPREESRSTKGVKKI